jgi:hypothetical protein
MSFGAARVVIASEAKQSRADTQRLDRFVAALLAMTPVSSSQDSGY